MGLAASSASGLFAFLHSGGDTKRLHAGHAAREGLLAALLAEDGMRGPAGVLESRDGFVQAFGDPAASRLLQPAPAGEPAAVTLCYIKPWACCRHIHPALDGLFDIVRATGIRADGRRADRRRDVCDRGDARADRLVGPAVGADELSVRAGGGARAWPCRPRRLRRRRARGRRITRICPRVFVRSDADYDARYPAARMARIRITGSDGRVHERVVDDGYGSPAQPMSDAALAQKFEGLVAPVTGIDRAHALRIAFAALDTEPDAGRLLRLLAV